MKAISLVLGVVLAVGLAAAAFLLNEPDLPLVETADPGDYFDRSATIEDRIRALEEAVAEERNARQLLEEELLALYAEIDVLATEAESAEERDEGRIADSRQFLSNVARAGAARASVEGRVEALVEAGLSQDRAEWLVNREAELQFEAMQARFEARRSGEPLDRFDPAFNPGAALREEIGDLEYEQYLEAYNRPTSVAVGSVLESSPGHAAGLQPGDQILSYDGQRVFNTYELTEQTMQGDPGESVVVDILRGGAPMQVVLPRGPIGITTQFARGRR